MRRTGSAITEDDEGDRVSVSSEGGRKLLP
jgi:hypothetical protein